MTPRGFTIVDLVAGLFLLILVVLFSLAATTNLDNRSTRVKCASNLRQIGQAILLYCNDNKGPYPRTKYDRNAADHPTAYTGMDFTDPFAANCPQVNDVSAALYNLLRTEDVTSAVFICPATGKHAYTFGGGTHTALDKSNFPSGDALSYSYADPYPNEAALGKGYKLVQGIDPTFVVAADMNPGTPDLLKLTIESPPADFRKGNSTNHSGDGQNMLYGDGHVEFQNTPFGGVHRDNIYTCGESGTAPNGATAFPTGGTGIFGSPIDAGDSVLLPAAIMPEPDMAAANSPPADAPAKASPAAIPMDQGTDLTIIFVIASVSLLIVLVLAIGIAVARKKRSTPTA